MSNRKILPREIKVKEELRTLKVNYDNLVEENRQLREIRDNLQKELEDEKSLTRSLEEANKLIVDELERKEKIIRVLVDTQVTL